jgi:hypothetical protein
VKLALIAIFVCLLIYARLNQDVNPYLVNEDTIYFPVNKIKDVKQKVSQFSDLTSIRSWGCNRSETPLIFVHIGKSGGGSVRARFAAGAENFTRAKWWDVKGDNHFYPVQLSTGIARGSFCSSANRHFRMPYLKRAKNVAFEGITDCFATTPVGSIVGCPAIWRSNEQCQGCSDSESDAGCHTVYAGHNFYGNEIHWLPAPYLQEWWKVNWESSFPDSVRSGFQSLTPGTNDPVWCPLQNKARATVSTVRLHNRNALVRHYECSHNISLAIDIQFKSFWKDLMDHENYASLYASLPVQRTIVIRDPWSWLLSRFFYHQQYAKKYKCDDLRTATYYDKETLDFEESGFLYQFIIEQLFQLCGDDCINRYEVGTLSLHQMEQQAEANLRHGFSIVGLFNETDEFYDMVSK